MKMFIATLALCALAVFAIVVFADAPDCTPSKGNDCVEFAR